jgi:hypothetical protein
MPHNDELLQVLEQEIARCSALMGDGLVTFTRIVQAVRVHDEETAVQGTFEQCARDMQAAAQRGAETASRGAARTSERMHGDLIDALPSGSSNRDILTTAAFVIGYLPELSPEDVLSMMRYPVEHDGGKNRQFYSGLWFPPAIRSTAVGLAVPGDETKRLDSAAEADCHRNFALPDTLLRLAGLTTKDWGPNVQNLVWACPYPRYNVLGAGAVDRSWDRAIDRSAGLIPTTALALLLPDPRERLLPVPERDNDDVQRFLQGLHRAQLAYAIHSGGGRPRQLLITDWPELAEHTASNSTPMVDRIARITPESGSTSGWKPPSDGRILDIPVPQGDSFPIGNVDMAQLLDYTKARGRIRDARSRLKVPGRRHRRR